MKSTGVSSRRDEQSGVVSFTRSGVWNMDRRTLCLAGIAAGLVLLSAPRGRTAEKWVDLYNGKDLTGWHVKDGKMERWRANGDMISCSGAGGGWLTSDKEYGDFVLAI